MNVDAEFRAVAVVGVGQEGAGFNDLEMIDEGMENARVAVGVGARSLQLQGCTDVFVESMEYAEQAAEGSALAVGTAHSFPNWSFNGVSVEVRSIDWIESKSLNSFLMVAKGSCEPPIILEIAYCGTAPEDKPILLLGKGITFNSGGLCLRPKDCLSMYRGCMSGAAACVGVIRAAAALSLPLHCCTAAATIYKPRMVVDIATVGYDVCPALGGAAAGIFSNSNFVYKQFEKAGALTFGVCPCGATSRS
ncbi:cytosol aminopeptidase-like [Drosophila miranda]|uniref:cytosol aminopeptidase-like n=1 Tax=Drosophila miranda TaxID=7229 RepID=UPI00143FAC0E|nr:cytosol aminopeptidase-like [Drosophila miranda]